MSGKMVATIGDTHSCPMFTGTTPHVGGVILSGSATVLLNNSGVARMGDKCICADGSIAIIIQGYAGVLVDGKPIAFVGAMTSHGGVITSGKPGAFIMAMHSAPTNVADADKLEIVTMPIELMPPFAAKTYIAYLNKIANQKKSNEADQKEEEISANGYLTDLDFSF